MNLDRARFDHGRLRSAVLDRRREFHLASRSDDDRLFLFHAEDAAELYPHSLRERLGSGLGLVGRFTQGLRTVPGSRPAAQT